MLQNQIDFLTLYVEDGGSFFFKFVSRTNIYLCFHGVMLLYHSVTLSDTFDKQNRISCHS